MLSARKRQANGRTKRTRELEDSMSQELADLGLLEQGMTYEDKEHVLNVVRMSENTAQAEEEVRKAKEIPDTKRRQEDTNNENKNEVREVISNDRITQCFFSNDGCTTVTNISQKEENSIHSLGKAQDATLLSKELASQECIAQCMSNEVAEGNTCENAEGGSFERPTGKTLEEKDDDHIIDNTSNDGSSMKGTENNQNEESSSKEENNVKGKNIDVFFYSNEPCEKSFSRSKLKKVQEKIPFYFIPRGMDVHKYTAYFKLYVNAYLKQLSEIQRHGLERMEWGPPIGMGNPNDLSGLKRRKLDDENDSSPRRYNFRDRFPKQKIVDFTSENSEEAEEEESNDDEIFTPKGKKLPGIKLSGKRKLFSHNEAFSPKKDKKENVHVKEKKTQDVETTVCSSVENEELMVHNTSKLVSSDGNSGVGNRKGTKSKLTAASQKRLRKQGLMQNDVLNDVVKAENVDSGDAMSTELVIVPAEHLNQGPQETHQEIMKEKPAPLSVKQRKLLSQLEKSTHPTRRKTKMNRTNIEEPLKEIDEIPIQELDGKIACPICGCSFMSKDIEAHASDCNQYTMEMATVSRNKRRGR